MKNYLLVLLFSYCLSCCSSTENRDSNNKIKPPNLNKIELATATDFQKIGIPTQPLSIPYKSVCQKIKQEKNTTDSLSVFLEESMIEKIFPFWYGTPWDFNGHTNIPNEGKIACGYFVSTTLKHLGFNLNRYRLAQQLPIHEAKTLSLGKPILEVSEINFDLCLKKIKSELEIGIYFVGLAGSHVGFLWKKENNLFFIHSNYGTPAEVIIETAENSLILGSFNHFFITSISNNPVLLDYWKTGKKIPIIVP